MKEMNQNICTQIVLVALLSAINGFDLQCPHPSHRTYRIQKVCNGNVGAYSCLYDTENKTYVELCADKEKNYLRAGLKYVITGTFRNVKCSEGRYQPIRFWLNRDTNCLFLKSKCTSIGQIIYDINSTIYDATYSCDNNSGFAFVSQPSNPCFCIPSEEDCSCYINKYPTLSTLSFVSKCKSVNSTNEKFDCQRQHDVGETDMAVLFQDNGQPKPKMHSGRIVLKVMIISTSSIAGIVILVLLICDVHILYRRLVKNGTPTNMVYSRIATEDSANIQAQIASCTLETSGTTVTLDDQSSSPTIRSFKTVNSTTASLPLNPIMTPNTVPRVETIYQRRSQGVSGRGGNENISFEDEISSGCQIEKSDQQPTTRSNNQTNDTFNKGPPSSSVLVSNIDKADRNGRTPLMQSCKQGDIYVVSALIRIGANINISDKEGHTPFYCACFGGNVEIVQLLLNKGCDLHKPNNSGCTPLMVACGKGHLSVVVLLIERGAFINIVDWEGQSVFEWSCIGGNIQIVNLLMKKGCNLNKSNREGRTPLMSACGNQHLPLVQLFLERNADINITDMNGQTPFFWSCLGGHIDIVKLLIDKGCDIHKRNNTGETPLMAACGKGNLSVAKLLLGRGADINNTDNAGNTTFFWSCVGGNIDIVNLLIDGCDVTDWNTPLIYACGNGHLLIVKLLLGRGADVNSTNIDGETPLYWSCIKGNIDIVRLLIDQGSYLDATEHNGYTPLMAACGKGHLSVARLLIQRGADTNITDREGHTLLYISTVSGYEDILDLFK